MSTDRRGPTLARGASALPSALHSDLRLLAQLVERFFGEITEKRIRRGAFDSVAELETAIMAYLEQHNAKPKPFVWFASARSILEKSGPRENQRWNQYTSLGNMVLPRVTAGG